MIDDSQKQSAPASAQIGNRIAQRMRAEGINQSRLAKEFKVSQAWISRILSGGFTSRSELAHKLSQRFSVPFFSEHDEASSRVEKKLKKIVSIGESCSAVELDKIIGVLNVIARQPNTG